MEDPGVRRSLGVIILRFEIPAHDEGTEQMQRGPRVAHLQAS